MYTPDTKHDYSKLLEAGLQKLATYYGQTPEEKSSDGKAQNAKNK